MLILAWLFLGAVVTNEPLPPPSGDAKLLIHELTMLDDLIQLTEDNLKNQRTLRELVLHYQKDLALYLKKSSDKDTVLRVARTAHKLLEEIKRNHLIEAFETDFISELTLFSQIAQKKGIPRP